MKSEETLNWYAISTKSNFEKKVYLKLLDESIEAYFPLQKRLKQWSDRKKWVEEPLIRCYLFVRVNSKMLYAVLNTPGVVKFVSFSGKPVPVPDYQIDILKNLLTDETTFEISQEIFEPGDPVEIVAGKLMGLTGELVQYKGCKKVIVKLYHLEHSLILNIPAANLRKKNLAIAS